MFSGLVKKQYFGVDIGERVYIYEDDASDSFKADVYRTRDPGSFVGTETDPNVLNAYVRIDTSEGWGYSGWVRK